MCARHWPPQQARDKPAAFDSIRLALYLQDSVSESDIDCVARQLKDETKASRLGRVQSLELLLVVIILGLIVAILMTG